VAGLQVMVPLALALLLTVSAVCAVVLRRDGRLALPVPRSRQGRLLLAACAVVTLAWFVAVAASEAGWSVVVPDSDGSNHGWFAATMLLDGSVSAAGGYPLGAHLLAVLVGLPTSVPSALVVPMTVGASLTAVLGTAAVAARIDRAAILPSAMVAALLLPLVPWAQVDWGAMPMLLALGLVPGVAVLIDTATTRQHRGIVVLAVVALAGLASVHLPEAVVVGLVVGVLAVVSGTLRRRLATLVAIGAGAALLVAPLPLTLARAGAAALADPVRGSGSLVELVVVPLQPFVGRLTTPVPLVLLLFAAASLLIVGVVGAAAAWRSPWGRTLVLLVPVFLLFSASLRYGIVTPLTLLWFDDADRLVAQAAALCAPLIGLGLVRAARADVPLRVGVVVACGVLALQSVAVAADALGRTSVVTPADRAAFAWLGSNVRPGDTVLNDQRDGSVWAFEQTAGAVRLLFDIKPSGGFEGYDAWAARLYLRDNVGDWATDPVVRKVAADFDVRWVLVGERTFDDSPPSIDVGAVLAIPGAREVFRQGDAVVVELPRP
jgi:hypothetical protein